MDPKVSQRDSGLPHRAPGAAGPSGPLQWLHMNSLVVSLAGWKQDKERNEASCTAGHIRDITTTTIVMSCRTNTAAFGN